MATDPIDPNNLYLAVGMYTNGQFPHQPLRQYVHSYQGQNRLGPQ